MLFVHYQLERVTVAPMSWPYMTMRNPIGTCRQNISTLQVTSKNIIIFDLYKNTVGERLMHTLKNAQRLSMSFFAEILHTRGCYLEMVTVTAA